MSSRSNLEPEKQIELRESRVVPYDGLLGHQKYGLSPEIRADVARLKRSLSHDDDDLVAIIQEKRPGGPMSAQLIPRDYRPLHRHLNPFTPDDRSVEDFERYYLNRTQPPFGRTTAPNNIHTLMGEARRTLGPAKKYPAKLSLKRNEGWLESPLKYPPYLQSEFDELPDERLEDYYRRDLYRPD